MKFFVLFILISLVACQMVKRPKFPTSEYIALQDLYTSTNGSFWHWFNISNQSIPWNFTNPTVNPCLDNWQGITCSCSIVICSVSMLVLESHNLIGRLPDSIGQLSNLTILNLKRNQLTGIIPQEISRFKSLILLDLSINALTGPIPSTINNLQHTLQIIELRTNSLNYLPETFWNLTNLQIISLGENSFHQPLSCSIQQLIQLKSLNLEYNYFTSTLPDCFHTLQLLKNIQLSENKFIGKLPSSLFLLTNLISFALGSNEFTGTIPFDFNQLIQLKSLYLNKNSFYGNLSSCFYCSLNQLKIFSISNNYLTGTIPLQLSIQFNQSLHFLYLECNSFYGNIQFLNQYDQLIAFQLNNNFFTGNIDNNSNDSQLFSNHQLKLINCAYNLLTGELPYSSYWKIDTYQMNNNYLLSTISNDFHSFPTLLYFLLQNNYIYSTIPDVFMENTTRLEYLNLGNNLITGSISSSFLDNIQSVTQLLLYNNRLTNTIPIELMNNQRLVVLSLYSNQLIGTFSKEIMSHLYQLEELLLQNNQLTGSINNILNMTNKHSRINTIDISNNLFTGTIPDDIFHQPYLQSLLISSNCLKGSIPYTICNSRILQSFSMDGYSTAINCRIPIFNNNHDLFGDYFNGFTLSNYLEGGIPNCLFELPTIQSLHLSGLGSYGHLPNNINLSNNLTDLSLSHNLFTGTIPLLFQDKDWMNLDLSYNKFTGTLSSRFNNTSFNNEDDDNSETRSLSLQVNRLSGIIPSSLLTMENISILTGNIFECDVINSNLPNSDSASKTYSCGSNNVNYVLYCWLFIVAIAPLLALLLYELMITTKKRNEEVGESPNTSVRRRWTPTRLCQRTIETLHSSYFQMILWRKFLRENKNPSLRRFSRYHEEIRSLAFYIMMYSMFVLLPVYSILTIYYSSYTNEYAWTISAMLLTGFNAGIVLFFPFLFFVIMIILLIQSLVYRVQNHDIPLNDDSSNSSSTPFFRHISHEFSKIFDLKPARTSSVSDSRWVVGTVYFSIFIVNVIIMSIADFSYVYIVITYDTYISSITAFFLAFFRIITNNLLLSKALPRVTTFYSNRVKILKISKHSMQLLKNHQYSNQDISFLELLILFNNIVIPIFAVMCILPDCFYNALFSSNSIQTSYTLQTCNGYVTNDESTGITDPFYFCNPVIQEVSYVPPFIYSYQCSSKIIINYVPVYTVMFLFVSLLSPLFHILCHIWYNAYILPSKDTLTWYQRMIMKWMIPNHIKELQILQNHYHYHYHSTTKMNQQSDHTINNNNNNDDNTIIISVTSLPVEFKIFSKLTLTVNIHSYLAIILSFGILFPPLAFIGYISIYILTIYEESNVARVLLRAITIGNYSYVEGVGKEFDGVEGSMSLTLWSTLFVCCGLYAYIIFDTIGDAIGWLASLPLALVMFFLPFTLWFIKAILRSWSRQHDEREVSMSHTQTVEKERSISSIQMISRPTNVISACSVENPILINSSHDPSLPSQV